MTDELVKLDNNKELEVTSENKDIKNPKGKGGFGDNPQNINRNGRPRNDVSITYWIKKFLSEAEPGHQKERAQELAEKIVTMAYVDGNVQIIKELLDRIEGTNPIKFDVERKEVGDLLQKIYDKQRNSTGDTDTGK